MLYSFTYSVLTNISCIIKSKFGFYFKLNAHHVQEHPHFPPVCFSLPCLLLIRYGFSQTEDSRSIKRALLFPSVKETEDLRQC